jgi:hypothetical protein
MTTPYFTDPRAFRKLGKRLFLVAVRLSRTEPTSKAAILDSIRAVKGRKQLSLEDAALAIAQLRDDMRKARQHRPYRKAGRSVRATNLQWWMLDGARPTNPVRVEGTIDIRSLDERLAAYKKRQADACRDKHLDVIGENFLRARRRQEHHVEFTFTDDPARVCFEGRSKHKPHEYCRIWTQTQSHWNVVLPRDWWDRVRPIDSRIAFVYNSLAVLDCKLLGHPTAKNTHLYDSHSVREGHYAVRVARQKRGFRIITEDGYIVRRTVLRSHDMAMLEDISRYGTTLEQAIAATDKADVYIQRDKRQRAEARAEESRRRLHEALATLKLVQSGHRSLDTLNEREKLDLLRVVQDQIANAQKRTATFGGIGQRAIHAEPHCAAA